MNNCDHIIIEVSRLLGEDAKGSVLCNGWNTLCPNHGLYIMGFNPGGDPDKIKTSVVDSLRDVKLKSNHCAYEDECWRKSCPEDCQDHKGDSRYQRESKNWQKFSVTTSGKCLP